MSRDSTTGVYTAPSNSFNPAVSGTVINSTHWNAALDDIETALSTVSATTRALWPTAGQVQDSAFSSGTVGGSANAVTLTLSPAPTAYASKMRVWWVVASTNTGAATVNVNSIGAKNIFKKTAGGIVALTGGEMVATQTVTATYDGTQFVLESLPEGTKGADIASASTVDLGAATGSYVVITGSTGPITSFGTTQAGVVRDFTFTGTPTITHNATSMILPGAADFTADAGACGRAVSLGSGNWRVLFLSKASGLPISTPSNAYQIKTANYTAVAGDKILADCTNTAWTLTLPASPANTDSPITVKKTGLYDLTINLNGKSIMLVDGTTTSTNPTIQGIPGQDFTFAYRGTDAVGNTNLWNF